MITLGHELRGSGSNQISPAVAVHDQRPHKYICSHTCNNPRAAVTTPINLLFS